MSQDATAAWLLEKVERTYGVQTQEAHADLLADINRAVDRLTRRYHFWFMDVEPDALPAFPYTDMSATAPVFDRWVSQGWMLPQVDKVAYLYATPLSVGLSTVTDTHVPDSGGGAAFTQMRAFTDPTSWTYAEVAHLNYVHMFSDNGVMRSEIEIVPFNEFYRRVNWQTSGMPQFITHRTVSDGITELVLSPKPNDYYLLQFGVRLATLPPLDKPHSTHAMLMYHPQTVLTLGLIEASRYFHEKGMLASYYAELYGPQYLQGNDPNMMPGGLVGEMMAETRAKSSQKYLTTKVYRSAAQAIGRRNIPRRSSIGKYYSDVP